MIGITSYGVHVPRYRLSHNVISHAWGKPSRKGEKAVGNYDEDSLTMAVGSAFSCLEGIDPQKVDALYYASTTSPYNEKLVSPLIATCCDLSPRARAVDFLNSLRSGTIALFTAMDSIKSGSARNVLITASDCRLAEPGSDLEYLLGDGSAAILLGSEKVIANIIGYVSTPHEFLHFWRRSEDKYLRSSDTRFALQKGYMQDMTSSIKEVISKFNYKSSDFSKAVLQLVDPRSQSQLAGHLGFDPKTQLQDHLVNIIGITGTAHPLLMLISALEESNPGDKILWASYGDGADAIILEVTEEVKSIQKKSVLKSALESKREMSSYTKYLTFNNLIKGQEPPTFPFTSPIMLEREKDQNLKFYGKKCTQCQTIFYPKDLRVCTRCRGKDKFEPVKLSKEGKVFTFDHEYYFPCPDAPTSVAVIDLAGGGRVILQATDTPVDEIKGGVEVELTFRKYHEGGYFHNYYWKCRAK